MNTKRVVRAVVLLLGCFFFPFIMGGLIANEMPVFIEIDHDVYPSDRKGPVPFEHEMHLADYEIACSKCHHVYKDGKNIWEEGDPVQKCASCHDPLESEGNIKNLRLAFHKNCKGCHRELNKEGQSDAAPFRRCSGCHEKKS